MLVKRLPEGTSWDVDGWHAISWGVGSGAFVGRCHGFCGRSEVLLVRNDEVAARLEFLRRHRCHFSLAQQVTSSELVMFSA